MDVPNRRNSLGACPYTTRNVSYWRRYHMYVYVYVYVYVYLYVYGTF